MPEVVETSLFQRPASYLSLQWLVGIGALFIIGLILRLSAGFDLTSTIAIVALQATITVAALKFATQRSMIVIAAIWLGLPYLIFAFGWLHWFAALLLSIATCSLGWHISRHDNNRSIIDSDLLVALCLLFTWMNISGIGHVGHQSGDWVMHTGRLYDLIEYEWPVIYRHGLLINSEFWPDDAALLVGYFGYQLPAALIGKLSESKETALAFLSCWTWLGFIALALGVKKSLPHISVSAVAVGLIIFGGNDVTLYHLSIFKQYATDSYSYLLGNSHNAELPVFELPFFYDFWSMKHFQFFFGAFLPLNLQLHFSPNQVIAVWLACALLIYFARDLNNLSKGISCISLLFIWSPFGAISLSILWTIFITTQPLKHWRHSIYSPILPAVIYSFIIFAFYYSTGINHSGKLFQFSWQLNTSGSFAQKLITFHLYCWGIYAAIILISWRQLSQLHKRLFIACIGCLIIISLFNLGVANDLMVRASAAPYFILLIILISTIAILFKAGAYLRAGLLITAIIISSTSSLLTLQMTLKNFNNEKKALSVINYPWGYEFLGETQSPFTCYFSKHTCTQEK